MARYDYFIFELTSVRLGGETCSKKTFDFILILCFILFTLEHESFSFQPTFFKPWVICVHVSLRLVVSFSFVKVCMYLLMF